jgi:23S rRNA (pseudouridine1915-N3)-methyltransferase
LLFMRIRLIWEGKTKNAELRALQDDYSARIRHFAALSIEEVPPFSGKTMRTGSGPGQDRISSRERRLLEKVDGSFRVYLDPAGQYWTSEEFANWLGERARRGTRELAFLVGGPEGFSAGFKANADRLLALSRMTFTREWARVLLLEQIYRGFTILHGYPYSK